MQQRVHFGKGTLDSQNVHREYDHAAKSTVLAYLGMLHGTDDQTTFSKMLQCTDNLTFSGMLQCTDNLTTFSGMLQCTDNPTYSQRDSCFFPKWRVQGYFTSTETGQTIRDGEPRMTISTFTQLLSSDQSGEYCCTFSYRLLLGTSWRNRFQVQETSSAFVYKVVTISVFVELCKCFFTWQCYCLYTTHKSWVNYMQGPTFC